MTVGKHWARSYFLTIVIGWLVLAAAGVYMARTKEIPAAVAIPIVAAFLLEFAFYMIPGFEGLRHWLSDRVPPRLLALAIAVSGIVPYLVYSLPTGQFRQVAFVRLTVLVFVLSFWYVFRRSSRIGDLALLGLVSVALVTRLFFGQIYVSPHPAVETLSILGKLIVFRLVPMIMLILREIEDTGFGFLPTAKEWKVGVKYFFLFLPVGVGLSFSFKLFVVKTSWIEVASAPLLFVGFFLVVALPEEFLARGLLQQWLSDWTGRREVALILAACAFGLTHLWFGRESNYPNWKMAITAAVAGWFYGRAYIEGGGVRAAAIAHALVVTTWRTLA